MKLYDVIQKEQKAKHAIEQEEPRELPPTITERPRRVRWRKLFVLGATLFFLVILYVAGMKFVRAKVIVTERRIPFTLQNAEFELIHESEAGEGRLSFQSMMVSTEVTRQVYGAKVEQSTTTAKGKVVFFNEYSTKAQTIKAKTTLTSSDGKKYQTTQAVTVPGFTMKGKLKTAGTSPATPIVAVAVGPSYNTPGTSFSVAGWGKSLYAQSSGAISGGEDGMLHSVAEADRADVLTTLQSQLTERLKRETRTQIPDSLVAYPELQVPSLDASSVTLRGPSVKFPATMKGTMTTYLIDRAMFERAIASHVLRDEQYAQVRVPAIEDLVVTPVTPLPTDAKNTPETIKVRVSGQGVLITKAPLYTITESLLGARTASFGTQIGKVREIDTAEYRIYPFWAPFFPAKQKHITIEVR